VEHGGAMEWNGHFFIDRAAEHGAWNGPSI